MIFGRLAASRMIQSRGMASGGAQHAGGMDLWRKMSYFLAVPAVIIISINTYIQVKNEHSGHHERTFIPYEHLRLRNKRFPWGDGQHSFFHNPHTNPLPDGYED